MSRTEDGRLAGQLQNNWRCVAGVAAVATMLASHPRATGAQVTTAMSSARVPFGVGEEMVFDVKFSVVRVGSARMEVVGIEEIRGRPAYHIVFTVSGGIPGVRVDDHYDSWIDTLSLASLRHVRRIREARYHKDAAFEIYPERAVYTENGGEERASVSDPLDDGSFIYFVRTLAMRMGARQEFNRYFRPESNPVVLEAVREERIEVPAGAFDASVLRPSIKTTGIFSEGGRAEVWFSRDPRRLLLQLKSKLSFGSLNLYLRSYRPPR